jgi:hypothetical protein
VARGKREPKADDPPGASSAGSDEAKQEDGLADVGKTLKGLVAKAQAGDEEAMATLRAALADDADLWKMLGGITRSLLHVQLESAFGRDLLMREMMERHMKAMRAELAGEGSTPLERLLADRVAMCWLQLQHADAIYAQAGNVTLAQGDYHQRRQDRAHRRFLSACKTLAVVRRLAIPALQVNIGEKQVNIAGTALPHPGPSVSDVGPANPERLPGGQE